ncbi:HNH endonuclease [Rhodococcus erythropolis]|nr:HNH endonuclease [Rhodococcus erythropolis]
MRNLTKRKAPDILIKNGARWTKEYIESKGSENEKKAEKWRHDEIKAALAEETFEKCVYCESIMADITYPHVEHIVPKGKFPELAHKWDNLTWSCPICNNNKREYYNSHAAILNPFVDTIDNHLRFHGDFVDFQLGSIRGEITINKLDLNRMTLVEARIERLKKVKAMLERWHSATGAHKEMLESAIRIDCLDGEFRATVCAYLASFRFPLD